MIILLYCYDDNNTVTIITPEEKITCETHHVETIQGKQEEWENPPVAENPDGELRR